MVINHSVSLILAISFIIWPVIESTVVNDPIWKFCPIYQLTHYLNNEIIKDSTGKVIGNLKVTKLKLVCNENVEFKVENYANLLFKYGFAQNRLRVVIIDEDQTHWQIPKDIYEYEKYANYLNSTENSGLDIEIQELPFGFRIFQKDNNFTIFDNRVPLEAARTTPKLRALRNLRRELKDIFYKSLLINFSKLYLQIGTIREEHTQIMGLGERIHDFVLKNGIYTIFNMDQNSPVDNGDQISEGKIGGGNMYGSQPFALLFDTESRNSGGILLFSSNAMDVKLTDDYINYKIAGGVLDLHFIGSGESPSPSPSPYILNEDPERVIRNLHSLIGRTHLPPFSSLGWHQNRWGYKNTSSIVKVYEGYTKNKIPLDYMWADIDYMIEKHIFTLDRARFSDLPQFIKRLHSEDRKFVPIVDVGIWAASSFSIYKDAFTHDVLIKDASPHYDSRLSLISPVGEGVMPPIFGHVWPGKTAYVDFFNPDGYLYWTSILQQFYNLLPYDGIWLDMNEPSSFCNGKNGTCAIYYTSPELLLKLPYTPGKRSLSSMSISMTSQHYPYSDPNRIHFNVHNLYGYLSSHSTYHTLLTSTKLNGSRPFVISRANFLGQGQVSGHWLGDNFASWSSLKYSIAGVLNSQLFGMNMVGADICGFHLNTTHELCERWHQLGAFYPFSRNHNDDTSQDQEPFRFAKQPQMDIMKEAIQLKYVLILYLYNLLWQSHLYGGTIWRPMFFEFPSETATERYFQTYSQFMFGSAILVSPVLQSGDWVKETYFPKDTVFYEFHTGIPVHDGGGPILGGWKFVSSSRNTIPLFIRGGYIIPIQDVAEVLSTKDLRRQGINLLVALSEESSAIGQFILDDGYSQQSIERAEVDIFELKAELREERLDIVSGGSNGVSNALYLTINKTRDGFTMRTKDEFPQFRGVSLFCYSLCEFGRVYVQYFDVEGNKEKVIEVDAMDSVLDLEIDIAIPISKGKIKYI